MRPWRTHSNKESALTSHQASILEYHASSLDVIKRVVDMVVIILVLLIATTFFGTEVSSEYLLLVIFSLLVFQLIAEGQGLYRSWRTDNLATEVRRVISVWAFTIVALAIVGFGLKLTADFSRLAISNWILLVPVGLAVPRLFYRKFLYRIHSDERNFRTVAFGGGGKAAQNLYNHIRAHPWMGLKVLGYFDDRANQRSGHLDLRLVGNLQDMLNRARAGEISVIYVTLPMHAEQRIIHLIDQLQDTTASVFVVPDVFVLDLFHADWSTVAGVPVVSVFESPFFGINGGIKRVEDLLFGSLILLLISPLMLLIALGIKLTSKGTILFKQRRYGLNGQIVEVWKFRSMTASDDGDHVVQARKNDPRVTKFGAFLRRTSLDELPQFINVLQGCMSIVGPRPHAIAHNEEYRRLLQGYMLRHKVKPGITGWAQVNGWRGETDSLDKMKGRLDCDLTYVRNWSFWLDIKIIAKTITDGFVNRNAY
jgi:undecaprenyl-phosphate glucose phosphotransferase